jgi:capsular polysaccharide biosynthesis protein
MSTSIGEIRTACEQLRTRDFDAVLAKLGTPDADDIVGRSIVLAARGAIFDREGRASEAADCFDRVHSIGVPLPVLLDLCGEHFKRTGRYDRAYECYSLLSPVRPGASRAFLQGLPARELVRYAPMFVASAPSFYALQPLKAALAHELGAAAAAFIFAKLSNDAPSFTITRKRITGLRDYAQANARDYEELTASRPVFLPPAPRFGSTHGDGVHTTTRTSFFCRLTDVVVANQSSFILRGDDALLDVEDDELERFELNLDVDPLVFGPDAGGATFLVPRAADTTPALERALSLTGVSSLNFGHWLLEYLPKVFACLGRPGFASVPILIDSQMPRQHREALELFIGLDHPVVELQAREARRVDELWACSAVTYLPLGPKPRQDPVDDVVVASRVLTIDADAFAALLARVSPGLPSVGDKKGPKRIYLARTDRQRRRIENRDEVEGWFAAHGFAILNFGELDFREQLELVRGADVVVGPDGSSTFITFFARQGTRIGMLSNAFAEDNEWYALVCQALGQSLLILTGDVREQHPQYRDFSDYRIDVGLLPEFVSQLSAMT